jgi:5-methylcytosine-specific restriction endonuclease McrA
VSWEGDPRTSTPEWRRTRRRVLDRDGHLCTWLEDGERCAATATEVDHIVPHSAGGTDEDRNLRSLCSPHHRRKSAAEGVAARNKVAAQRRRPTRPHPGAR